MEAGRPMRMLLQYGKVRDDSTRVITVKGSEYILKAEPTEYDVRYESKKDVRYERITSWHLRLSKWKGACMHAQSPSHV